MQFFYSAVTVTQKELLILLVMLSIRLARFGKKKQPSYRIIVCQKHKDPLGDYIAKIGHINYYGGTKNVEIDTEAAKHWISVGAQPTRTVHNLLLAEGVLSEKKTLPKGIKKVKAQKQAEEAVEKGATKSEEKTAEAEGKPDEQPAEQEATATDTEQGEEKKAE